ncbi:flavin reductase [Mangrovimonas aestuarii]|uniref:flavin reductase n=1 Tax=Mangrovimonas aestuarii TaxID=3018443 RepID=UPI002378B988|nr:flavin reductase [Mangrovimonas aestuarii]
MEKKASFKDLDISTPIWDKVFIVAPLVVVGTKEGNGYDLAPKHMATPLGFDNYFGFVCTPEHSTYNNVLKHKSFSASFPLADNVTLASLTALPRDCRLPKTDNVINALPTHKATLIDTLLLTDAYLHLECSLFKIIDGFGSNSIITGKIIAAKVNTNYFRASDNDEQKQLAEHGLLAFIAPNRFANITETYNFPFPKNFKR